MEDSDEKTREILEKYKRRIKEEFNETIEQNNFNSDNKADESTKTWEYKQFKNEMLPTHFTLYEKACNLSEKILKIKPDKNKIPELEEAINIVHLNITPTGVSSFAILGPLVFILLGLSLSVGLPYIFGQAPSNFFIIFFILAGVAIMFPLQRVPVFLADAWRLKASSQMVICVFYIVTYMRHTSNLELAIEFASNYLSGPLALDMKKMIWDIETGKYSTLKDSLDAYLETWRKHNLEFVESMHLIESSLYESSEDRRVSLLEKSLDVMLEETFEKMMHYAQGLKSPITALHMLGIILPVLGLVILPLVVNFMDGVKWYYLAMLYNVVIPFAVFYLGKRVLAERPTGYGDTDISEMIPEFQKYKKIKIGAFGNEVWITPLYLSIFVGVVFLLIGLSPILVHTATCMNKATCMENIGFGADTDMNTCKKETCLMEYRTEETTTSEGTITTKAGPFDIYSSILSFFVPLGLGLSIGLYFYLKTKKLVKLREEAKALEREFSSALFQLGNRLSDNLPAEVTFGKVADVMKDTVSGRFFNEVSNNIKKLGVGVKEAIFDPNIGAIKNYPSNMIQSSMKVLIQAIKKSPRIAAGAVLNISRYIKEMHRVDERLKDLLSDIISSMKSQVSYLAPVISGIVIGIASMMTNILGKLGPMLASKGQEANAGLADFFGIGIPTYYFQIIVGVYIVEIVYILSVLVNGIENGYDKLNEEYMVGANLIRGSIIYTILALGVMVAFNYIADKVILGALTG
jgi:hypothetical protein